MMHVNAEKCIGCGHCITDCFARDIELVEGKAQIKNIACFKCGHCIAVCPKGAVTTDEFPMEDVKEYKKETFAIEPENLLNFVQFRRSTRQFLNKDVEKEKLSQIIEAGRFTQTATNMQDISYIVVKDQLNQLKTLAFESLKKSGEYLLAHPTPENMIYQNYAKLWIRMYDAYHENPANDQLFFNAPAVIIVTGYSDINGGLASSNMELMTNALGLGTFFSGFFARAAQDNEAIQKLLDIPDGKHIISCMVIGYPKVKYHRTVPRKPASIHWR